MTVRMLRSTIQGEMRRDYVRTAISRGNDRGRSCGAMCCATPWCRW